MGRSMEAYIRSPGETISRVESPVASSCFIP